MNLEVSLYCTPSCTDIGTDLGQARKTIAAAYRNSGRFSVIPSDRVDFEAAIRLRIDREDDWLDAGVCGSTFGLLPAFWHDTLRLTTVYTNRQGSPSRRLEQTADVSYHCHLFLAPLLPFRSEPDVLNRRLTMLTNSIIAKAEAERIFDQEPAEIDAGGL